MVIYSVEGRKVVVTLDTEPQVWSPYSGCRCMDLEGSRSALLLQGVFADIGQRASAAFLEGDAPLAVLYELTWPHTGGICLLYYDALWDRVVNTSRQPVNMPLAERLVSVHVWRDGSTEARQLTLEEFRSALSSMWVRAHMGRWYVVACKLAVSVCGCMHASWCDMLLIYAFLLCRTGKDRLIARTG